MSLVALFVPSGCDYNLGQRLLAHVLGSKSVASVETEPFVDVINGSFFFWRLWGCGTDRCSFAPFCRIVKFETANLNLAAKGETGWHLNTRKSGQSCNRVSDDRDVFCLFCHLVYSPILQF